MLPTNFPPCAAVHQQTQRRIAACCLEAMVHDLWALLRVAQGGEPDPTAVILDGRTLRSTPELRERIEAVSLSGLTDEEVDELTEIAEILVAAEPPEHPR